MSRFPAYDPFRIAFQKSDGVTRPEAPYGEAGSWHDNTDNLSITGCMPVLTQVTDFELTGADPSTGEWVVLLTPVLDALGNAASNGEGPVSISFTAAADTLADVVLGLIAVADTAAGLSTPEDLAAWNRFRSFVTLSVSPTAAEVLRVTANASGQTFEVSITFDGAASATETAITTPGTDVLSVGCYCAHDTDNSLGAYNNQGQPHLELIAAGTSASDYMGPVMLGTNMASLDAGARYQTYEAGESASIAVYGHPRAYGEKAIPASSIGTVVYVRHTASGNFRTGTVTDAAGAAVGATANVWTWTPTAVDSTLYQVQISIGDINETIAFTSGVGTTATLICNGLRTNLLTKQSLTGLVAGSGTTTLILTGPADGRAITPVNLGPGAATSLVETTAEVSTHRPHPRGDTFLARSPAAGSVPISIPHP